VDLLIKEAREGLCHVFSYHLSLYAHILFLMIDSTFRPSFLVVYFFQIHTSLDVCRSLCWEDTDEEIDLLGLSE
jgi:hypothetical protein